MAAREGVFTLSNPGHALFGIGLALSVLGVSLMLVARVLESRAARTDNGRAATSRTRAVVLPAVGVLVAVALAGGALRLGTHDAGHAHEHAETAHDHGTDHETLAISWERLQEIDRMLAEAKAKVAKYQDVNLARADGYRQYGPVVAGQGAHFVHPGLLAANVFDLTHPPYLIYENGPDGGLALAGVGWALPRQPGDWTVPYSPFGPLATWHAHNFSDICIRMRGAIEEALVNVYPDECAAAGGTYIGEHPWILHAWLFTPSPEGVFGASNSAISGIDLFDERTGSARGEGRRE
ncbi:MAG: hypothetical protein ACRDJE_20430 [Dehalococcoidia bacterium]